jgi:hypothetical protein
MAIQDVMVVSIPVSDQARAEAFYVETLGSSSSAKTSPSRVPLGTGGSQESEHLADPGDVVRLDARGLPAE